MIMSSTTFIDYDSIDNPIRSIYKGLEEFFPHVSYLKQNKILLNINKFSDTT